MILYHTSQTVIKEIHGSGRFGSFLFFSTKEYVMTASSFETYKIDLDESNVINASSLFYHDDASKLDFIVAELSARLGISDTLAILLLDETKSVYDIKLDVDAEELGEISYDIQLLSARCAEILGYRAVRLQDEQGAAYLVNMLNKFEELE